jgi:hypothetical protein
MSGTHHALQKNKRQNTVCMMMTKRSDTQKNFLAKAEDKLTELMGFLENATRLQDEGEGLDLLRRALMHLSMSRPLPYAAARAGSAITRARPWCSPAADDDLRRATIAAWTLLMYRLCATVEDQDRGSRDVFIMAAENACGNVWDKEMKASVLFAYSKEPYLRAVGFHSRSRIQTDRRGHRARRHRH